MDDAVSCSVSNSNEDINIPMIKRIKSSENNGWKRQVQGGVVSCFFLILHQSQLIQPWSLDV